MGGLVSIVKKKCSNLKNRAFEHPVLGGLLTGTSSFFGIKTLFNEYLLDYDISTYETILYNTSYVLIPLFIGLETYKSFNGYNALNKLNFSFKNLKSKLKKEDDITMNEYSSDSDVFLFKLKKSLLSVVLPLSIGLFAANATYNFSKASVWRNYLEVRMPEMVSDVINDSSFKDEFNHSLAQGDNYFIKAFNDSTGWAVKHYLKPLLDEGVPRDLLATRDFHSMNGSLEKIIKKHPESHDKIHDKFKDTFYFINYVSLNDWYYDLNNESLNPLFDNFKLPDNVSVPFKNKIPAISIFLALFYSFNQVFALKSLMSSNYKSYVLKTAGFNIAKLIGFSKAKDFYYKNLSEEDSGFFFLNYANYCFKTKNYSELFKATTFIKKNNLFSIYKGKSYLINHAIRKSIGDGYSKMQKNPDNFTNYIFTSLCALQFYDLDFSKNILVAYYDHVKKDSELLVSVHLSEAVFYKNIGEIDEFKKKIKSIISNYYDKLGSISEHEVYQLVDNDFSKNTFCFRKSYDNKVLLDDISFCNNLSSKFLDFNDDEKFKILNMNFSVDVENSFYGVMNFESGDTLEGALRKDPLLIRDSARFLGRLLASNPVYKSVDESVYVDEAVRKLNSFSVEYVDKHYSCLCEGINLLLQGFGSFDRFVNLDFHRLNLIVNDNIIKIDNQKKDPCPALSDCSKLLGQGGVIPPNLDGDALKDSALKIIHDEFSNVHNIVPFDEFLFYKLKYDPIKALSFAAYVVNKRFEHPMVRDFLLNAYHSISRLKPFFPSKNDYDVLDWLGKAILDLSDEF